MFRCGLYATSHVTSAVVASITGRGTILGPMQKPPLVVDLDGTLLVTDTLHEQFIALLIRRPVDAARAVGTLLVRGRAALKAEVSRHGLLDVEALPLRTDFIEWLKQEAASGRELHLVSAADGETVRRVAEQMGLFTSHKGSDGTNNLKADQKAAHLAERFPEGFSYAGDSAADLAVWPLAQTIVLAGASPQVVQKAEALGRPIEARFENEPFGLRTFVRQLRLHQWSKNILVFVPLLLAHRFHDTGAWLATLLAFLGLSIAASATYILNDLFDLGADRRHESKRFRPLAAGHMGVAVAAALIPLLLLAGLGLALSASVLALVAVLVYLATTISYSMYLKRIPLLDTGVLGILFTIRILIGCAAAAIPPSPWMLAFSITLFFSLSIAKRQTEIMKSVRSNAERRIGGRGYELDDAPLTLAYGISTGVASLVILMLYTTNGVARDLYREPNWLWAIPLLLLFWQLRIWLLAHRGQLNDDPIVFALKDKWSLLIAVGCAITFYMAL